MNPTSERGSVLILVLIAVLILSLIGLSGLTQTGTEIGTSRNFMADKTAFYLADAGTQFGLNLLKQPGNMNPGIISFSDIDSGVGFYTGTIDDTTPQLIQAFTAFRPPPVTGISVEMSGELGASLAPWLMTVSSVGKPPAGMRDSLPSRKQIDLVLVTLAPEY